MHPLILNFIRRAFTGIERLPAAERADQFEAASILLKGHNDEDAIAAMEAAEAIRNAEGRQIHFHNLLSEEEGRDA